MSLLDRYVKLGYLQDTGVSTEGLFSWIKGKIKLKSLSDALNNMEFIVGKVVDEFSPEELEFQLYTAMTCIFPAFSLLVAIGNYKNSSNNQGQIVKNAINALSRIQKSPPTKPKSNSFIGNLPQMVEYSLLTVDDRVDYNKFKNLIYNQEIFFYVHPENDRSFGKVYTMYTLLRDMDLYNMPPNLVEFASEHIFYVVENIAENWKVTLPYKTLWYILSQVEDILYTYLRKSKSEQQGILDWHLSTAYTEYPEDGAALRAQRDIYDQATYLCNDLLPAVDKLKTAIERWHIQIQPPTIVYV